MKLTVSRITIWAARVPDRPAGLADVLAPLKHAGADLEFILARRAPESPGTGVVFLAPLKGAKQHRAAQEAGFFRTDSLHAVRVEGPNRKGLAHTIASTIARAQINLRGFSTSTIGRKLVAYLAVDDLDDATRTMSVLRRLAKAD